MTTPQTKELSLARALNIPTLYLKREDLHPYGSHKGRSIPLMIDHYLKQDFYRFAISSSGNSALSVAMHVNKLSNSGLEIYLDIFVGENVDESKLSEIEKFASGNIVKIQKCERPLQELTKLCRSDDSVKSLRQSTDDVALTGYHELAEELLTISDLSTVFIATSSGTTAQALGQIFKNKKRDIKINIIQTTSCHPMASEFDQADSSEKSLAGAIVDITAHRKIQVLETVKESGGSGFIATNEEITEAQNLLKKYADIDATANGALSLAGLIRALSKNWKVDGSVCCIISGK